MLSSDGNVASWHPQVVVSRPNRFNRGRAGGDQPQAAAAPAAATKPSQQLQQQQQPIFGQIDQQDGGYVPDMDWAHFAGLASDVAWQAQRDGGLPPMEAAIPQTTLAPAFASSNDRIPSSAEAPPQMLPPTMPRLLSPAEWLGDVPQQQMSPDPPDRGWRAVEEEDLEVEAVSTAPRPGMQAPEEGPGQGALPESDFGAAWAAVPLPLVPLSSEKPTPSASSADVFIAAAPAQAQEADDKGKGEEAKAAKEEAQASSTAQKAPEQASRNERTTPEKAADPAPASASTSRPVTNVRESDSLMALQALLPHLSEDVLRTSLREHGGNPDATYEAILAADDLAAGRPSQSAGSGGQAPSVADARKSSGSNNNSSDNKTNNSDSKNGHAAVDDQKRKQSSKSGAVDNDDGGEEDDEDEDEERGGLARKQQEEEEEEDSGPPPWLPMLRKQAKAPQNGKKTFYDLQTERLKAALAAPSTSKPSSSGGGFDSDRLRAGGS